jgi:hypothetical protein
MNQPRERSNGERSATESEEKNTIPRLVVLHQEAVEFSHILQHAASHQEFSYVMLNCATPKAGGEGCVPMPGS